MKRLLERYDLFLMDLWGVMWDGRESFPEAVAFCHELRRAGKTIRFVSNSAEYLPEVVVERLRQAGLEEAGESWVATSGMAMKRWAAENGLAGRPAYVFGAEAIREYTRRAGMEVRELPQRAVEIADDRQSDTLVMSVDYNCSWKGLMRLISCVRLGELRVVLPNPDRIVMRRDGTVDLPPGMIGEIMRGVLPDVSITPIGKPYPFIFDFAMEGTGFEARRERVLMIGDSLETDIAGARNAGIDSLLVGQGVHLGQSLEEITRACQADGACPRWFMSRLSPAESIVAVEARAHPAPNNPCLVRRNVV